MKPKAPERLAAAGDVGAATVGVAETERQADARVQIATFGVMNARICAPGSNAVSGREPPPAGRRVSTMSAPPSEKSLEAPRWK